MVRCKNNEEKFINVFAFSNGAAWQRHVPTNNKKNRRCLYKKTLKSKARYILTSFFRSSSSYISDFKVLTYTQLLLVILKFEVNFFLYAKRNYATHMEWKKRKEKKSKEIYSFTLIFVCRHNPYNYTTRICIRSAWSLCSVKMVLNQRVLVASQKQYILL